MPVQLVVSIILIENGAERVLLKKRLFIRKVEDNFEFTYETQNYMEYIQI